ncbi:hypothetical protein [Nisaea sp.]|uniref:hypothetical protein n=1 Tax=Nisaea sp. TaxID=2024842 RepID=UPI003296DC99
MLRILNCIFLSVLVVITYWALHIGTAAYQDAEFAKTVGRVPTWIGAFFGTIFAVSGAYLISQNKHEAEKKELKERFARIIWYATFYYTDGVKAVLTPRELIIKRLGDGEQIARTQAIKLIRTHRMVIHSDLPNQFWKDISCFDTEELSTIVNFFRKIQTLKWFFTEDEE